MEQDVINVAVSSIASAIELGEHATARQIAEEAKVKIEAVGGVCRVNPYWYGCDMVSTASFPTDRYGDRTFEYLKWPTASTGSLIEFQEKQWRVVANYVSPGKAGQWVNQFGFYAIMPI